MPLGDPSPNFSTQVAKLVLDMGLAASAAQSPAQRAWFLPSPNSWDGSPFDLDGISSAFDREDLNNKYVDAIQSAGEPNGGKVVDRMTTKIQIDYLACMERAFRARHASSVRCAMHSAGRRSGQGDPTNGVLTAVRNYLAELVAMGHQTQ